MAWEGTTMNCANCGRKSARFARPAANGPRS